MFVHWTENPLFFFRSQKLYEKTIFLPWRCWRIIEFFEKKWLWNPCFHKLSNLVWQLRLRPKQRCSWLYNFLLTMILHINSSGANIIQNNNNHSSLRYFQNTNIQVLQTLFFQVPDDWGRAKTLKLPILDILFLYIW